MSAGSGDKFEAVTCGCPRGAHVNVPHRHITDAIQNGWTPHDAGARLPNRPQGAQMACVTAAQAMVDAGIIPALPDGWE